METDYKILVKQEGKGLQKPNFILDHAMYDFKSQWGRAGCGTCLFMKISQANLLFAGNSGLPTQMQLF